MKGYKKILVVGSGPIKIGEAAEFDYSGSQALKALREEGIESVVINPNVATVQTTHEIADRVYLLPLQTRFVENVILREKPDGVMFGFGGQNALNVGYDLYKSGFLKKHGVKILGTNMEGISDALLRGAFQRLMTKVGIPVPPSGSVKSKAAALRKAEEEIGYPVMMRVSFNLGGRGSFIAKSRKELEPELERAFAQSRVSEVLIEEYLDGWKELEYEIVRDIDGNAASIACLENLDPMGVHTGESTVVAPQQTLDNKEYQEMRSVAIRVAESIGLVGECNVQFALDPASRKYYVIETNPRMSRSSALASKATGYPIAYVSAKLALGYRLYEIRNSVSKATNALFEPSLDYITVKVPRWNLDKFEMVDGSLSSEMKSIGEVMAIGRDFIEALDKSARMLDIGEAGLCGGRIWNSGITKKDAIRAIGLRKPYWFLYAAKAFSEGAGIEEVWRASKVDRFFLELIREHAVSWKPSKSASNKISVKQIDTLAGEAPAEVNYLYTTQKKGEDDVKRSDGSKLLILGPGCFRIGVSVEFDYLSVNLARNARRSFDNVLMLNYNPETVSTDWDVVDKLYFDCIDPELVKRIIDKEGRDTKVAVFTAGQIGNNISHGLDRIGAKVFGHGRRSIDVCEDRNKFSGMLEKLGIKQPEWISATSDSSIRKFVDMVGFPIVVRPSYVLSGSAMKIAHSMEELRSFITYATRLSSEHPVLLSKYIDNAIEAEMDCVTDGKGVYGVTMQHIEEAGVHSGDSTMFIPNGLPDRTYKSMKEIALSLSNETGAKGPFNIQFVVDSGIPKVIEMNMRCSRSMPFSSKASGIDIMKLAVKAISSGLGSDGFHEPDHRFFAVKSPQFSWSQLKGAYPSLGLEMKSTGESAAFGWRFSDALLKSWLGASPNSIPEKGSTALIYSRNPGKELKEAAGEFSKFTEVKSVSGLGLGRFTEMAKEEAIAAMRSKRIGFVATEGAHMGDDYLIRRAAVDMNIPIVLNGKLAYELAKAIGAEGSEFSNPDYSEMGEYR